MGFLLLLTDCLVVRPRSQRFLTQRHGSCREPINPSDDLVEKIKTLTLTHHPLCVLAPCEKTAVFRSFSMAYPFCIKLPATHFLEFDIGLRGHQLRSLGECWGGSFRLRHSSRLGSCFFPHDLANPDSHQISRVWHFDSSKRQQNRCKATKVNKNPSGANNSTNRNPRTDPPDASQAYSGHRNLRFPISLVNHPSSARRRLSLGGTKKCYLQPKTNKYLLTQEDF